MDLLLTLIALTGATLFITGVIRLIVTSDRLPTPRSHRPDPWIGL